MQPFTTIMKLILLFFSLTFVQSANRTRRAGNGSYFYEPVDAIDFAFDEFPKLIDVLPTLVQKKPLDYDNMPGVTVKNISIDIEKIDINKFKKRMNVIAGMIAKDEPKNYNASRRQAYINPNSGWYKYQALGQMIRRRTVDLMLQVLYMSWYKIKKVTESKHFSTTDTGFRIGFLCRRLNRIHNHMMKYFSFSHHYMRNYETAHQQIVMHGRVTRLHVDFCYLWWVLINVDNTYRESNIIRKQTLELRQAAQAQMAILNAENINQSEANKTNQSKANKP